MNEKNKIFFEKIKKPFNPLIEIYSKLKKFQRIYFWIILGILTVYAIFMILAWFGISLQIITSFYRQFMEPIGFDFKTPFLFFLFFGFIIFSPLFVLIPRLRKTDIYFKFTIYTILFLLIFGICFINESYKSELPQSFLWNILQGGDHPTFSNSPNCTISKLECESVQDKKNFVFDDEIMCNFKVNENCSFILKNVEIVKFLLNNDSQQREEVTAIPSQGYFKFKVEENLHQLAVYPGFYNNSQRLYTYFIFISPYNKYSSQDYNEKLTKERYEKSFLLISLISLSLVSVIVSMNNLKQLLEKK